MKKKRGKTKNLGLWVVRNEISAPERIDALIEMARNIGAGRLYLQVVGRGDAYYNSEILPIAETLKTSSPGFDPLKYAIGKAAPQGIKISAWMNANFVWPFNTRPKSPNHVINKHPEWVTYDNKGISMLDYESTDIEELFGIFLDPALPEVKQFFIDIADEISGKYPVEEIHCDFIRYPYRTFGYNPRALGIYKNWLKDKDKEESEQAFDEFRIEQVSNEVKSIYEVVHKNGKNLSSAVYDRYDRRAIYERLQPWVEWIKKGYLDSGVIMAYSPDPEEVSSCAKRIVDELGSLDKIRIGLGAFKLVDTPQRLISIIDSIDYMNPDEITLFSSASVESSYKMQVMLEKNFNRN